MPLAILNTEQIKALEAQTVVSQGIVSYDLMQRAAQGFVDKLLTLANIDFSQVLVVVGCGNNGGDGLLVALRLKQKGYCVRVVILKQQNHSGDAGRAYRDFSHHFRENNICLIKQEADIAAVFACRATLIIDALLGTGVDRPLQGLYQQMVFAINQQNTTVVAIDMPSGLYTNQAMATADIVVRADYTLTFHSPKLALLLKENSMAVGELFVIDIGLLNDVVAHTQLFWLRAQDIKQLLKTRLRFCHKNSFGHALIIAGSKHMMGAAILQAKACLRSGVGMLSVCVPKKYRHLLQISVVEAMCYWFNAKRQLSVDLSIFNAFCFGSGMGAGAQTKKILADLLTSKKIKQLVVDADGLNVLAKNRYLLKQLPKGTVLTPHPGEWSRLIGQPLPDDFENLSLLKAFAKQYQVTLVYKEAVTVIVNPQGELFFITSGTPALATAGSGDVLAGLITGYLAQGYSSTQAAILATYLHGNTGAYLEKHSYQSAVIASDLVQYYGEAKKMFLSAAK